MSAERGGFTIKELVAAITISVVLSAVAVVLLGRGRQAAREEQDAMQVRGLVQSLVVWRVSNDDSYPLPSRFDPDPSPEVSDSGFAKNTTANIYSLLIWQGVMKPELLISPLEINPNIRVCRNYQMQNPKAAVDPANANWDPAFSVDFTNGKVGHASYAHLQLSHGRRGHWRDTFSTTEAVVANRGPALTGRSMSTGGQGTLQTRIPNSNTLLIHGPRESWEGNVAFNDGHIDMVDTLEPRKEFRPGAKWPTYKTRDGLERLDCLFYDEPDDVDGGNVFLGIWVKAGDKASEFQGIWD